MEFIVFGVKGSRQADPHLEVLPSTNNKSISVVEVGVVLGPVHALRALHQIYGSHSQEEICGEITVRSCVLPAFTVIPVTSDPPARSHQSPASLASLASPASPAFPASLASVLPPVHRHQSP